jgi:hypothetical protein
MRMRSAMYDHSSLTSGCPTLPRTGLGLAFYVPSWDIIGWIDSMRRAAYLVACYMIDW